MAAPNSVGVGSPELSCHGFTFSLLSLSITKNKEALKGIFHVLKLMQVIQAVDCCTCKYSYTRVLNIDTLLKFERSHYKTKIKYKTYIVIKEIN